VLCPASGTLFRNAAGASSSHTLDGTCGIPHFRLPDLAYADGHTISLGTFTMKTLWRKFFSRYRRNEAEMQQIVLLWLSSGLIKRLTMRCGQPGAIC